jgi:hypothetical protein
MLHVTPPTDPYLLSLDPHADSAIQPPAFDNTPTVQRPQDFRSLTHHPRVTGSVLKISKWRISSTQPRSCSSSYPYSHPAPVFVHGSIMLVTSITGPSLILDMMTYRRLYPILLVFVFNRSNPVFLAL